MSAALSLAPAERSQSCTVSNHSSSLWTHNNALQFNYQYKQLISATIVAGWDESEGGQVSHNSQTFSNHLTAGRSPSLPGSVSRLGERACRCPAAPPECLTCD